MQGAEKVETASVDPSSKKFDSEGERRNTWQILGEERSSEVCFCLLVLYIGTSIFPEDAWIGNFVCLCVSLESQQLPHPLLNSQENYTHSSNSVFHQFLLHSQCQMGHSSSRVRTCSLGRAEWSNKSTIRCALGSCPLLIGLTDTEISALLLSPRISPHRKTSPAAVNLLQ